MIGTLGLHIDKDVLQARHEVGVQERIVEQSGDRSFIRWQKPTVGLGCQAAEAGQRIDRAIIAQRPAETGRGTTGHRVIFEALRQHVKIAENHVIFRQRRVDHAIFMGAGQRAAFERKLADAVIEEGDLGKALVGADMVEMQAVDPERTGGRGDDGFKGRALHVHALHGAAARQKKLPRRKNRVARQDHIAELEAAFDGATIGIETGIEQHVATCGEMFVIEREEGREIGDHIGMTIAEEAARHFLKGDDIRTLEIGGDAGGVVTPIQPHAELDIVTDEFHDNL